MGPDQLIGACDTIAVNRRGSWDHDFLRHGAIIIRVKLFPCFAGGSDPFAGRSKPGLVETAPRRPGRACAQASPFSHRTRKASAIELRFRDGGESFFCPADPEPPPADAGPSRWGLKVLRDGPRAPGRV